ncbi:c-type cytochrome [Fontivita pretiosa]|uniref:c-type cytochrome n=1 Tax=Fontivita pretiosa TaxID=2989684 RepID=UPI003D16E8DF
MTMTLNAAETASQASQSEAAATGCSGGREGPDLLAGAAAVLVPLLTLGLCAAVWMGLQARQRQQQSLAEALAPRPAKLDAAAYARGQQLYAMACAACHGPNGSGVAGLGKDLTRSTFVRRLSDAELAAFITEGRPADHPLNTTKVPMPPKGGRADFSDQNIADIVAYLRGLSDPRRIPSGPLPQVELVIGQPSAPLAAQQAESLSLGGVESAAGKPTAASHATFALDPQAVARGKKAYISCMACHGKDARGIKNMGKDLVNSEFVAKLSDEQLVEFIKRGRGPTDPENTTKVAMPPKGGNPALKDEQIRDIVAYLRSLQNPAAAGSAPAEKTSAASPSPAPEASSGVSATASTTDRPTPTAAAISMAAPAGSAVPNPQSAAAPAASAGDPARGKKAYISCMACHGKDARGIKNMGKDLVNSEFVAKLSDEQLVEFIKRGRGPTDPENTTKIAMPPKGGNPALKDEQIRDIVAYLRSLRQSANVQ